MPSLNITGLAYADSGILLLARILGRAGTPVTQATLTAISYAVWDRTADASLGEGTLDVGSVVFDALQRDAVWGKDDIGYNFSTELSPALFPAPAGGHRIVIDVQFSPATGHPFHREWEFDLEKTYA